jgi:hypothetical protein
MQKRLVILSLLLVVAQTFVPIYGKASDNPAGGSQNVQKQPEGGRSNTQSLASAFRENGAGPAKHDTDKPISQDTNNSVTVRELPTVSIGKDWADWSYWGFGGLLVIVGSSQVWYLYRTLKAIQIQAGHMERQTKALEDSVAAAQKSADAALAQVEAAKSTQRAQLRIEFVEPEWIFSDEFGGYPISFRIILDGTTRAYVLNDSIIAYIGNQPRELGAWMGMGIPRNFTPEMSPFYGNTILRTAETIPQPETDDSKVMLAKTNKLTVFLNGSILYRDIFGEQWMLEIDRYWSPWSALGDVNAKRGHWPPVGSGRYDTHRKVDTGYRDQLPKTN